MRRTKIVGTLGPATDDPAALQEVVESGLDVARFNLSHGAHGEHRGRVEQLRKAAAQARRYVGVLCDLQGPKIRTAAFRDGFVELSRGQSFFLDPTLDAKAGDQAGVGVGYAGLPDDVTTGDTLMLADGLIRLRVTGVEGRRIHTEVEEGGTLSNHKGINRLGGGLSVAALTDKDREDIRLAAEMEADYLAVSFCEDAADVEEARSLLRQAGGEAGTVAKVERQEAVANIEAIMQAADAVMIARGDLGVEIGDAQLPGVQKRIMRLARELDCVVITATQMMQSMVSSPVPTRAEVLDVANAVLDGTDAVMLSEETAVGRYPAAAVAAMNRVCVGAERYLDEAQLYRHYEDDYHRVDEAIAKSAIDAANRLGVKAIAAMTESGATVMWMSRVGTPIPVYAMSEQRRTRNKVTLYRGVHPVDFDPTATDPMTADREALAELKRLGVVSEGEHVLITKGDKHGITGGTNTMKIVRVGEV
ncbi:pyruvate kinase [Ectothiorhodospiraceae bacterium WFHF3C12]|nr:pyruvate kinase [Ectothiorhodospiraceae bacterium WFHF3C12]